MSTLTIEPNDRILFRLAYEDDDLLVVEKPARVPTQPGKGHATDTLLNALFSRFGNKLQKLGAARDFGLLHRLDKPTSGLLIVALKNSVYDALRVQFEQRQVKKFYWAVCDRVPKEPEGVLKMPIVESMSSERSTTPKTARVARVGKPAVTAYRVLASNEFSSLIEARPVTGRLHQVRVHLDAIGCAVLGDEFYGPRRVKGAAERLMLHAHRLIFTHPVTGVELDLHTAMPRDMKKMLKALHLPIPKAASKPAAQTSDVEEE